LQKIEVTKQRNETKIIVCPLASMKNYLPKIAVPQFLKSPVIMGNYSTRASERIALIVNSLSLFSVDPGFTCSPHSEYRLSFPTKGTTKLLHVRFASIIDEALLC